MHCVYSNSMAYVPAYLVLGLNLLLHSNYHAFNKNNDFNAGFAPLTFTELLKCLLFGNDTTNYLKHMDIASYDVIQKSFRSNRSGDIDTNTTQKPMDYMIESSTVRVDEDHVEFPFSASGRYAKSHLAEACSDAQNVFLDQDDAGGLKSSGFANFLQSRQKKFDDGKSTTGQQEKDEEEEELSEFELKLEKSPTRQPRNSIFRDRKPTDTTTYEDRNVQLSTEVQNDADILEPPDNNNIYTESNIQTQNDKVWKRMSEFLPEQNARVAVKSRRTLKQEIIHNKVKLCS